MNPTARCGKRPTALGRPLVLSAAETKDEGLAKARSGPALAGQPTKETGGRWPSTTIGQRRPDL